MYFQLSWDATFSFRENKCYKLLFQYQFQVWQPVSQIWYIILSIAFLESYWLLEVLGLMDVLLGEIPNLVNIKPT